MSKQTSKKLDLLDLHEILYKCRWKLSFLGDIFCQAEDSDLNLSGNGVAGLNKIIGEIEDDIRSVSDFIENFIANNNNGNGNGNGNKAQKREVQKSEVTHSKCIRGDS